MLLIRFRDGAGRVLDDSPFTQGWWTPLALISSFEDPGGGPPRRLRLTVPARGRIDLREESRRADHRASQLDPAAGPCEVQVMLAGYPGRRWSDRRIEVVGGWQPASCPAVNAGDPTLVRGGHGRRPARGPSRLAQQQEQRERAAAR